MEIVLEVPDKDVARVLELVRGIKRVKVKSPSKAPTAADLRLIESLREAGQELARIKRGEEVGQSWEELYAELKAEQEVEPGPSAAEGRNSQ
ncbi:hypothetical protein CDA63_09905 [Hymenobacter amundsenii]|uniref:Uncharacterized protein n=1 Tax=Hymenobacter amundsenii TaxID=2006685 RepID=A0A2D0AG34_9BACT|nr:hypothetical protein [Hymenobacter amundsenii]OWP63327.1 hypothetical protein CDA63_09905 [Hymenobacter amundsenii]